MKLYYFLKDDSNDRFHDIEMVAWSEHEKVLYTDTNERESSFKCVEQIRLHASKSLEYRVTSFTTDFGKNSCRGHNARSGKALIKEETKEDSFYPSQLRHVSRDEYESYRNKLFEIYQKEMFMDLDKLEDNQPTKD